MEEAERARFEAWWRDNFAAATPQGPSFGEAERCAALAWAAAKRDAQADALDAASFKGLCNTVARDLPEGYELRVCLERGAGWVTLHNPDGDVLELDDLSDASLEEQVGAAIDAARNEPKGEQP